MLGTRKEWWRLWRSKGASAFLYVPCLSYFGFGKISGTSNPTSLETLPRKFGPCPWALSYNSGTGMRCIQGWQLTRCSHGAFGIRQYIWGIDSKTNPNVCLVHVQFIFLFMQFGRFATTSEPGLCKDCVALTLDSFRFCITFCHYFLVLRSGKFWTSQTSLFCIRPWSIPGIDEGQAFTPSNLPFFWVSDTQFRLINFSGGSEAGREGHRLFFLYGMLRSPG